MSKDNISSLNTRTFPQDEINKYAANLENDASFTKRANSYRQDLKKVGYGPSELKVEEFNGTLSVLEGLGANVIRNTMHDSEINKLIETINKNKDACLGVIISPQQKETLILNVAKTEAALKGFELPLKYGSGPFNELNYYGLEKEDFDIPINAVKNALLKFTNQGLSKADFTKSVMEDAVKTIEGSNISVEKIENCKKFIQQGIQNPKNFRQRYQISQEQYDKVTQTASENLNGLINTMLEDIKEINNSRVILADVAVRKAVNSLETEGLIINKNTREKIFKENVPVVANLEAENLTKNPEKIIYNLETRLAATVILDKTLDKLKIDKGLKISPKTEQKIKDVLGKKVEELGSSTFLAQNSEKIIESLAKSLNQEKLLTSKLTNQYNISIGSLDKIARNTQITFQDQGPKAPDYIPSPPRPSYAPPPLKGNKKAFIDQAPPSDLPPSVSNREWPPQLKTEISNIKEYLDQFKKAQPTKTTKNEGIKLSSHRQNNKGDIGR